MELAPYWFDLTALDQERRCILELSGADTERFVQGLISADVKALASDQAIAASLLTVKGKLLSDALVWRTLEGHFFLAFPQSRGEDMREHVDRHIIMDDVQLRPVQDRHLALQIAGDPGEGEAKAARALAPPMHCNYPLPGLLWFGEQAALDAQRGDLPLGQASDFDRLRIQSGTPAWSRELDERRLPPEAGFTSSISYTKGCFMGQEPLARIHARGRVNRVLVRLSGTLDTTLPAQLSCEDRPQAGELTTWSSQLGQGLAIVHRSVAQVGKQLQCQGATLQVQSAPLGDDPGIPSR